MCSTPPVAVPGSLKSSISPPLTRSRRFTCAAFCSWKYAQLELGSPAWGHASQLQHGVHSSCMLWPVPAVSDVRQLHCQGHAQFIQSGRAPNM